MSVLALIEAGTVGVLVGYYLRGAVDRYMQASRERVVSALTGEDLPEDWERRARAVEAEADKEEAEGFLHIAAGERQRAENIRRIGRERLKRERLKQRRP